MNKTTKQKLQSLVVEALQEEKDLQKSHDWQMGEAGRAGLKTYLEKISAFQDRGAMTKKK